MASADAIIFDHLPLGLRAGYMSPVRRGQCRWTPTAPTRRRPAIAALDCEIELDMAAIVPGYNRL